MAESEDELKEPRDENERGEWKSWLAVVHGVTKSRTWLSSWTELNWTEDVIQMLEKLRC